MKKLSYWIVLLLLCALVGCGDTAQTTDGTTTAPSATTTTESTTTENATTTKVAGSTQSQKSTTIPSGTLDEPLTLTVEKPHGDGKVYMDVAAGEANYTLKLTANVDLRQLRLIGIDSKNSLPEALLSPLSALKKGENQYVLTHLTAGVATRGVMCTDTKGNTYYYAFVCSDQSKHVYLAQIKATH